VAVRTSTPLEQRLLNRELSWLEFNARVLAMAADPEVPLLERVRFCAIFSSNLDEFFMVRVAGLLDQVASGVAVRSADGMAPTEALAAIRERVETLSGRQARLWRRDLCPALAKEGIVLAQVGDLEPKDEERLSATFERDVFPVLTPLAVGPGQPFPFISPLSLSLGVIVRDPRTREDRFARVKVAEGLPRFLNLGRRGVLIPLEAVIGHFLPSLFPGMEIVERAAFRVTRDADFEVSDEADDLLQAVQVELRRRRFAEVVRLEVASSMSAAMLARLRSGLRVDDDQVYRVHGPLDLADATEIAALDRLDLKYPPWHPVTQPRLTAAGDFFDEVAREDILVHQPYESFLTSFDAFVRTAAKDPGTVTMKTAVYRTRGDSPLVPALVAASEAGKQSVCLVELKARFDERSNIEWARKLEQAGVHVVYGFPNMKIHAKMTLVVRREEGSLRRYAHVGTGNYHALTARSYEDVGLFTADEEITADLAELFNYLTGFGRPSRFRKLLVAPFMIRERLIEEIARTGEAGEQGRIRIKVNHLTDPAIIEALYAASSAGVEVDVVARTTCALRPGVARMSERIRVRSVLGRFLEHSRLFHFQGPGEDRYFLGSADLMPRNLDHRIEILVPVTEPAAQSELDATFDALLADTRHSWELLQDGNWRRRQPRKRPAHAAQQALIERAQRRTRPRTNDPVRER
jgi:polyphosphate kinase